MSAKRDHPKERLEARKLLSVISYKWRGLILCTLGDGPCRYNELAERVTGITNKMLTQDLRGMAADGLIERTARTHPTTGVLYSLTPIGTTISHHLRTLCNWSADDSDDP